MEEGKLPISRHFFKVMMPGFLTKLSVPPAFCKRLNDERTEEAVLSSSKGRWNVKIGKFNNGMICFSEGWDEFARRHDLNLGDFVVFEHRGGMNFDVLVFDPSACEKEDQDKLELMREKEEPVIKPTSINMPTTSTNIPAEFLMKSNDLLRELQPES